MKTDSIIHFKQVWAAYRVDPVLKDVTWHWQAGQQWAILGGNGAGKSAIATLITDTLRPQRGEIDRPQDFDADRDILHLSFELQRKLIEHDIRFDDSEVRADALDVGTTVKQIILHGKAQDDRFMRVAKQCHIDHILERGIRFVSTGESRKALLARALYNQPKLLILDNPFEGLDKQAQAELHTLIDQLLLSHLPILLLIKQTDEVPENVSHVMLLEDGVISSQGQRDQILSKKSPEQQPLELGNLPAASERAYTADRKQPLIDLRNVDVSYNDQAILTDISWQLDWGQHCCIAGPNGAGKSTLLNLICGDNHKAYGQNISLFGQRRGSGESIWEIKQKFGVVNTAMQLNHIGRTRVAEVIAAGFYDSVGLYNECSGQDKKIALDWLRLMGLESIATKLFNQLSFGQQRLAMLARAMVKSPLILILDEPCIGLDLPHRQLILALIEKIAATGDCHILYVSHTAREMPRCINQHLELVPHKRGGYTGVVSHS